MTLTAVLSGPGICLQISTQGGARDPVNQRQHLSLRIPWQVYPWGRRVDLSEYQGWNLALEGYHQEITSLRNILPKIPKAASYSIFCRSQDVTPTGWAWPSKRDLELCSDTSSQPGPIVLSRDSKVSFCCTALRTRFGLSTGQFLYQQERHVLALPRVVA